MKIALWIVQILLALFFLGAGFSKAFSPLADLGAQMVWVNDVSAFFVRFPGIVEILGAIGLILPAATRIQPRLTPLAAGGLMLITLFATIFHLTRGEFGNAVFTLVLLALAGFVAYGRWKLAPIAPR
ncbi:MAG: DoxX family protein [Anaerolineae bacterium]|nr:DoxX family protein [Anaerolineae bacterium]